MLLTSKGPPAGRRIAAPARVAAVMVAAITIAIAPAAFASASPAAAKTRPAAPAAGDPRGIRTPSDPDFTVNLTSDADGFVYTGTESISFTNSAPDPLKKIWLRLWGNGLNGCLKPLPTPVSKMQGGKAGTMTVDCTALPVTLDSPLGEGQTTSISFHLKIRVPDTNWRFGRIGPMALVGNALPVLAIHDAVGGWHLEPYTPNGESFYSQVGHFSVTIRAPKAIKLATTGTLTDSVRHGTMVTSTFDAPDVRDFAWASGPFNEEEDTSPSGVLVKVWWMDPISKPVADSMLTNGKAIMAAHAGRFGPFPYPEVDVVLGNFTRFGGMEYPNLVMQDPSVSVLAHELAHQWWFGIVGDDEYNEPWLDEAFASYATDLYFGNDEVGCQLQWPSDTARVTNSMAYWDTHPGEYGATVYTIGACSLHDLGRALGKKVMADFIHDYAVEHALAWSTTDAFKAEAQAVADTLDPPVNLKHFWKEHRIDNVP
jgi:hypothetical protein